MTRREIAVKFRGQLLNEAPDLTSDSALRRAMRARRKTRGIGYTGDAGRDGRVVKVAVRTEQASRRMDTPMILEPAAGSNPAPAPVDITPLLVRFRRIDR